jgi:hypothetical protein
MKGEERWKRAIIPRIITSMKDVEKWKRAHILRIFLYVI